MELGARADGTDSPGVKAGWIALNLGQRQKPTLLSIHFRKKSILPLS